MNVRYIKGCIIQQNHSFLVLVLFVDSLKALHINFDDVKAPSGGVRLC